MTTYLELRDTPQQHISPSQLEMLRRCPRQFEYRYVKGIKLPPPFAVGLGTVSHITIQQAILDDYVRKNPLDFFMEGVKEIEKEEYDYSEYSSDSEKQKDISLSANTTAYYISQPVFNNFLIEEGRYIEKEEKITFPEIDKPILMVYDIETQKEVIDWKLTSQAKKEIPFQLKMYKMTTSKPVSLHNLVKTKNPQYHILTLNEVDISAVKEEIQRLLLLMKSGIFIRITGFNYMNCKMCGYVEVCKPL